VIASSGGTRRRGAPDVRGERGVALLAAVFAMAIIGALVASSFFVGRLEQQSGQSTFFAVQAREAAEAGLAEAMAGVPAEALENLPVGGPPLELGLTLIGHGVTARSQVRRLTNRVFLIRADGQRHDAEGTALATRSLGLLVQLNAPTVEEPGSSGVLTRLGERGWVHLY
jgi:hypothetical protein